MTDSHAKTDSSTDAPHAKTVTPEEGTPDQLEHKMKDGVSREEALVDEGLEETFPASDPVSAKHIT